MKYSRHETNERVYINSIMRGGEDTPWRLIKGELVEYIAPSTEPLMRIRSFNKKNPTEGDYALGYQHEDGEWEIADTRFKTWQSAEKHLYTLGMFFKQVGVFQVWTEEYAQPEEITYEDEEITGEI